MMRVCVWLAASSASRMAMTCPSIIAEGATMSAPAAAMEQAIFWRMATDESLSTSPVEFKGPQWP